MAETLTEQSLQRAALLRFDQPRRAGEDRRTRTDATTTRAGVWAGDGGSGRGVLLTALYCVQLAHFKRRAAVQPDAISVVGVDVAHVDVSIVAVVEV